MKVVDLVKAFGPRFRAKRNRLLKAGIARLCETGGQHVKILDVGGYPEFWKTVRIMENASIVLLNLENTIADIRGTYPECKNMELIIGDARDLSRWESNAFDLVVSNSLIEHVGDWNDIHLACCEIRRMAPYGWIQTPAFSFPIEPHFVVPLIHWFAAPVRARLLPILPRRGYHNLPDIDAARRAVERINLLTKKEMRYLFSGCGIRTERFLGLTKSYIATWPYEWWDLTEERMGFIEAKHARGQGFLE